MSPAGAYAPDSSLTGKASFGFVSKYKKGSSIPTGNTEFQFKAGNLNFHSGVYDWLVIIVAGRFDGKGDAGHDQLRFFAPGDILHDVSLHFIR